MRNMCVNQASARITRITQMMADETMHCELMLVSPSQDVVHSVAVDVGLSHPTCEGKDPPDEKGSRSEVNC